MGVVFVGHDSLLNRQVAIKRLKIAANERTWLRFQQEAMACAALQHPNIVSIFDFGADDDGVPYIVLDYLQGETLAQHIAKRVTLTFGEMFDIVFPILDGLEHAHKHGIVHRDLKPANIFLQRIDKSGKILVKIMDFGVAKVTSDTEIGYATKTGEVVGSPYYASPEQISGETIDGKADLYSLGCMIFEMLTGKRPFVGESVLETFMMHKSQPAPLLGAQLNGGPTSDEVEQAISKLLEKNPKNRFQSVAELRQALLSAQKSWCSNPKNFVAEQEHRAKQNPQDSACFEQMRDAFQKPGSIFHSRKLKGLAWAFAIVAVTFASILVVNEHQKPPSLVVATPPKSVYTTSGLVPMRRNQVAERIEVNSRGVTISLSKVANVNEVMAIIVSDFPNLNILQLDSTPVTPETFKRLLRIPHLSKIELVEIPELGAEHIDVLARIKSLTVLDVKGFNLPGDIFRSLKDTKLEEMFIGADLKEEHLKDIAQIESLQVLNVNTAKIEPRLLPLLAPLPNLHTLNMDGMGLHGYDLGFMSKMRSLCSISLRSSCLKAGNLEDLAPLVRIQKLSLEHTSDFDDDDLNELVRVFPNLTYLGLKWTKLTDAGVPTLLKFKSMENLDVASTKVSDKSIEYLSRFPKLNRLVVTANLVTPTGVEKFMRLHPRTYVFLKPATAAATNKRLQAIAKETGCTLGFENEHYVNDAMGEFAALGLDPGTIGNP